jgi:hypothetical protein
VANVLSDAKYQFSISGFRKLGSVLCSGSKAFMYSPKAATRNNTPWARAGNCHSYGITKDCGRHKWASLQFQIRFPFDNDVGYLSYAIPSRYINLVTNIAQWASRLPSLSAHRTLCQMVVGRACPTLKITSHAAHTPKLVVFATAGIHPGESRSSLVPNSLNMFVSFLKTAPSQPFLIVLHMGNPVGIQNAVRAEKRSLS